MAELVLATPILRGKTDGITNYEADGSVGAGLAVSLDDNGVVQKFDGSKALTGVSGYLEANKRQSVIKTGLGVAVRVAAGATPAIGVKAYVDPATGLFTTDSTKTATRAVFMSEKSDAINARTRETVADCAVVDFEGGLNV